MTKGFFAEQRRESAEVVGRGVEFDGGDGAEDAYLADGVMSGKGSQQFAPDFFHGDGRARLAEGE